MAGTVGTVRGALAAVVVAGWVVGAAAGHRSCGKGTYFDDGTGACRCDAVPRSTGDVYLGGVFDVSEFPWAGELFAATTEMLNNRSDGWFDDVLPNTTVQTRIADGGCQAQLATTSYWDLKTEWGNPLHGVVGCLCSGASTAVARVAGLESVPQVSPTSTASSLSNRDDFPSFFRMVAPDDRRGQVGALMSLLLHFGWHRVTVIGTDTTYTKDLATSFGRAWVGAHPASSDTAAWEGQVAYSHTVTFSPGGEVDEASVNQALDGVPTDTPEVNSRIVVLLAHRADAYRILEVAAKKGFQPDTVWVGVEAWPDRAPDTTDWMPAVPGYIGIVPFRNRDSDEHKDFLSRLRTRPGASQKFWADGLPIDAAEMADSILALALALSAVGPGQRSNGTAVVAALQELQFEGISGPVRFTKEGHRADPRFSVVNMKADDGVWHEVGSVGLEGANVSLSADDVCWAVQGCRGPAPSDRYPVAEEDAGSMPGWVWVVIPVIVSLVVVLAVGFFCWRRRMRRNMDDMEEDMGRMQRNMNDMEQDMGRMEQDMGRMQRELAAVKTIDNELADLNTQEERAKERKAALLEMRTGMQNVPDTWTDSKDLLVELRPQSDTEYWLVSDRLKETMPNAWVSRVWRVQNKPLWNYYSFHKNRLAMTNVGHNERHVWHGTSSLEPSIVYADQQDGFMMQFSRQGMWGRGIYFAENSSYSTNYAHTPNRDAPGRPKPQDGEREMFLAKLLVGDNITMPSDSSLTVPPVSRATGLKYNTVTGHTGGSEVHIVYENGRAYPDYIVRYYVGSRDKSRTPFKSRTKAMPAPAPSGSGSGNEPDDEGLEGDVSWQFAGDNGWVDYDNAAQVILERTYQQYIANAGPQTATVQGDEWSYEVDVVGLTQTNLGHSDHKVRNVRRYVDSN